MQTQMNTSLYWLDPYSKELYKELVTYPDMNLFTLVSTVLQIMRPTKKQRKTVHSQEKKQSTESDSDMTQMLELSEREFNQLWLIC